VLLALVRLVAQEVVEEVAAQCVLLPERALRRMVVRVALAEPVSYSLLLGDT
jgi:hypothetical protein